jgi:hypothetical protein
MRFQLAGAAAGFLVDMFCLTAEGFTGNADAGNFQTPEHRQNHHKGEAGNNLPKSMALSVQMAKIFYIDFRQDPSPFLLLFWVSYGSAKELKLLQRPNSAKDLTDQLIICHAADDAAATVY